MTGVSFVGHAEVLDTRVRTDFEIQIFLQLAFFFAHRSCHPSIAFSHL